jgi:hypothetical protein
MLARQPRHQRGVLDPAFDRPGADPADAGGALLVARQRGQLMARIDQRPRDVRTQKAIGAEEQDMNGTSSPNAAGNDAML